MADKIEQTIEVLIEESNRKGFLSYAEINALLEDQLVPPDRMDQIFMSLEDPGPEHRFARIQRVRRSNVDNIVAGDDEDGTGVACPQRSHVPQRQALSR